MPYPNEHSCRLVDPNECREGSFRRENGAGESGGRKFDVIYAKRKSDNKTVEQAYRYPTASWSEGQARQHCKDSDGLRFEPASQQSGSVMPEIYGKSWAITEQGLNGLIARMEDLDTAQALMTRSGEEPRNTSLTTIRDGVAVIEIVGPIFHYRNIITEILGFPAAEALAQDVQAALDNPQVRSILLRVDSPGGQVGGINELAGIIEQAGKTKRVEAYVADMGASAAYWLASAASRISVDATAELGSIGVVFGLARRRDDTLEIVNSESPQKRPDPDTDEGIELIRQRANELAEVFIRSVARNRGLSRDQVVAHKGGLRVGQAAVDSGLADAIDSLEGVIEALQNTNGRTTMDLETFKQNHADLYEQVKQEGRNEAASSTQSGEAEARKAAQQEVLEQAKVVLGDENAQLLDQAVQSGLTAEQLKSAKQFFAGSSGQGGGNGSGSGSGDQDKSQQILDGLKQGHGHSGLRPDQSLEESQDVLVQNAKERAGQS